jgi:peptidoglycan hydrolase CwlO-like protein
MATPKDIKGAISLVLAVIASLISLGSIAYAAGSLTQRVDAIDNSQKKLENMPERMATIEAKIDFLVSEAKERRK